MYRYEDLIAQGVELHQPSMPASNSFSNLSSVSDDTAPGNPQAGPIGSCPPTHACSQAAADESKITLLSHKSAEAAQISDQDRMMQSQLHKQHEATIASLSQGDVQTSHRAAGTVSMADGMSEPVTEAKRAPSVAGSSSDESHTMTDARGHLIKV